MNGRNEPTAAIFACSRHAARTLGLRDHVAPPGPGRRSHRCQASRPTRSVLRQLNVPKKRQARAPRRLGGLGLCLALLDDELATMEGSVMSSAERDEVPQDVAAPSERGRMWCTSTKWALVQPGTRQRCWSRARTARRKAGEQLVERGPRGPPGRLRRVIGARWRSRGPRTYCDRGRAPMQYCLTCAAVAGT